MPRGIKNGRGARYLDIRGQRFGRLLVLRDVGRDDALNVLWLCRCDCGTEKPISSTNLTKGHSKSCGCLKREKSGSNKFVDLTGKRFARLIVLAKAGRTKNDKRLWLCRCDCGTEKEIIGASMTAGRTVSCGCRQREIGASTATHGMSKTVEYKTWGSMIARCTISTATGYDRYGGRGITVCEEWRTSFEAFYRDMGPRPSDNHSLDRYPDVDGNYEPGNCRWATDSEQARNKRTTFSIAIGDEEKSLMDWCEKLDLHYGTVNSRIRKLGWTPEEALGLVERKAA